jgi:hypothetical protein
VNGLLQDNKTTGARARAGRKMAHAAVRAAEAEILWAAAIAARWAQRSSNEWGQADAKTTQCHASFGLQGIQGGADRKSEEKLGKTTRSGPHPFEAISRLRPLILRFRRN